jgi:hypothetical protein
MTVNGLANSELVLRLFMVGLSLHNRAIGPELPPHLDFYRNLPQWP